tara:strand:+ start:1389 stop:1589 length:201 start_codon:yes stop_codon:yes gene_type:complete
MKDKSKLKRIYIDSELRNRMNIKLAEFRATQPPLYMGGTYYHGLLHNYENASTIREDILEDLCGII